MTRSTNNDQVIIFPRRWCAPRSLLCQGPTMQSTVGMNYDFHHVIETYKRFFPSQTIVQMKQDYNIEFAKVSDFSVRVFREFYYKLHKASSEPATQQNNGKR